MHANVREHSNLVCTAEQFSIVMQLFHNAGTITLVPNIYNPSNYVVSYI